MEKECYAGRRTAVCAVISWPVTVRIQPTVGGVGVLKFDASVVPIELEQIEERAAAGFRLVLCHRPSGLRSRDKASAENRVQKVNAGTLALDPRPRRMLLVTPYRESRHGVLSVLVAVAALVACIIKAHHHGGRKVESLYCTNRALKDTNVGVSAGQQSLRERGDSSSGQIQVAG